MTHKPMMQPLRGGFAGETSPAAKYRTGNERVVLGLPGLDFDSTSRAAISRRVKSFYQKHGMRIIRTSEDVARFRERQRMRGFCSAAARREKADKLAASIVGQAIVRDVCSGFSLSATAMRQNVGLATVRRVIRAIIRRQRA